MNNKDPSKQNDLGKNSNVIISNVAMVTGGRMDWNLLVRVIKLWRVEDFKNKSVIISLDAILLNAKVHITPISLIICIAYFFF